MNVPQIIGESQNERESIITNSKNKYMMETIIEIGCVTATGDDNKINSDDTHGKCIKIDKKKNELWKKKSQISYR